MRIGRGDPAAISERARELCEQLERLLREGDSSDQATVIAGSWQVIADKAPAQLVTRYLNARELFELSRDPEKVARLRQRAQDRSRLETELGAIELALRHPSALSQTELQLRFNELGELHAGFADADDEHGSSVSVRFTRLGAQIAAMKPETVATVAAPVIDVEREALGGRRGGAGKGGGGGARARTKGIDRQVRPRHPANRNGDCRRQECRSAQGSRAHEPVAAWIPDDPTGPARSTGRC
ncbi:MAG: hypothetical protein IPP82_15165 [Xanthomonadales bacterium]|nr:hypothetical protein [Xanthomonadales bacterium]